MHFFFTITVPKNTAKASPHTETLILTNAIITHMEIVIPPGPRDLTGLQLTYHEFQLYPLTPGEYYHGDAVVFNFDEYQPIIVNPYELKAIAWNTDDTYDHDFLVAVTMKRPEELGFEIPMVSLQALYENIGEVIELPTDTPTGTAP